MNQSNTNDAPRASGDRSIALPTKVVVSLRAGAILALANVVCVVIFAYAWTRVKAEPKVISVTGSARRAITSDLAAWTARVSVTEPELPRAYDALRGATEKTVAFIKANGLPHDQIKLSSIGLSKRREKNEKGVEGERIVAYELWQTVEVTSGDVTRVGEVARAVTGLIKDGVVVESYPPTYVYTKLADLKITMLAEATRDAQTRARQIATNSGGALGQILDARMGVMQINPVHAYEATGEGRNDTSSLEKEITAVVSARFALQQ